MQSNGGDGNTLAAMISASAAVISALVAVFAWGRAKEANTIA
jgi:hypothetical protein